MRAAKNVMGVRAHFVEPRAFARPRYSHTVKSILENEDPSNPIPNALRRSLEQSKQVNSKYLDRVGASGEDPRDQFVGGLFDLTPRQSEAFLAYGGRHEQLIKELSSKYGNEFPHPLRRAHNVIRQAAAEYLPPIHVAITGAAGAIGYALAFRVASGAVFGPKVPVVLHLLELPNQMEALKGVEMELLDCAFPSLAGLELTDQPEKAFSGIDYAFLVGAMPRTKGMERGDLLSKNAQIFMTQGKALNKAAKGADTRVLVVGNPANTNALIASHFAPKIPAKNFVAMTRLDFNRGLAQIAQKADARVSDIDKFIIWGNHSATQVPDITHTTVNGRRATEILDPVWVKETFTPAVQQRGAAIIAARGASSAASAASSAIDQIREWHYGTFDKWTSSAVVSNGEYGVEKGLFFSYPVVFDLFGQWNIVNNLEIPAAVAEAFDKTHKELISEREAVAAILKQ